MTGVIGSAMSTSVQRDYSLFYEPGEADITSIIPQLHPLKTSSVI